jgi:hypothetical protein
MKMRIKDYLGGRQAGISEVVNPKPKLVVGSWRQIEGKKHTQTGRGS